MCHVVCLVIFLCQESRDSEIIQDLERCLADAKPETEVRAGISGESHALLYTTLFLSYCFCEEKKETKRSYSDACFKLF